MLTRKAIYFKVSLFLLSFNALAQDYTQWGLPDGAKARLGKGSITGNVAYSPDGTLLAVASSIGIWIYNADNSAEVALLTGHTSLLDSVAFSPDGLTLASGSWDKTIRLWDVRTGKALKTFEGHTSVVTSVAFSPDGFTLASGSLKRTIRLWDARTGEHLHTLEGHKGGITSVAFSPDGLVLVSAGGYWSNLKDKTIRLWDVHSGDALKILEGHTGKVASVAFSPDGKTLASGGGYMDNTVRLWDVHSGDALKILEGHTGKVASVAFSPDGKTLASGGGYMDNTVRLWDAHTGERLQILEGHTGSITSVVFSPDGTGLASGSLDGTVLQWDVTPYTRLIQSRAADVNDDGIVDILDLVLVAAHLGELGGGGADINGDGVVDLHDLELVAGAFGNAAISPPIRANGLEALTAEVVRRWLADAEKLEMTDPTVRRGIIALERLLTALTEESRIPAETALLPNYPNPFNPETWIPYQLKEAADVNLAVYDVHGQVVRRLAVGYRPAGMYRSRDRAAYWDGRNERGESVATGVYFCTLAAGDFRASRRMLVGK